MVGNDKEKAVTPHNAKVHNYQEITRTTHIT